MVGQEKAKRALLLHLVDPSLGGALLSGKKGTAKSTLVRSARALCGTMPFVELPLNVTEDRLLGSIDITQAVKMGALRLQEGLLTRSNNGLLYADEINLLPRHITALLLDAVESGISTLEREGLSLQLPAQFVLVGSMNPEEGGLSPQLLDRFAFFVSVEGEKDPALRVEIIRRRLEYEADPAAFRAKWQPKEKILQERLQAARLQLLSVQLDEQAKKLAVQLSAEACSAGNRAEIILCKAARALAAWEGASCVNEKHLAEVAAQVLPHRLREPSVEAAPQITNSEIKTTPEVSGSTTESSEPSLQETQTETTDTQEQQMFQERLDASDEPFEVRSWLKKNPRPVKGWGVGRRPGTVRGSRSGRTIKTRSAQSDHNVCMDSIALEATLRAALLRTLGQNGTQECASGRQPVSELNQSPAVLNDKPGCGLGSSEERPASPLLIHIRPEDLHLKIRQRRTGRHILFVVDASGSMGARSRMKAVKGAVLSLLGDAYKHRDHVGLVAFKDKQAELLLGFTRSVELAQARLSHLPTGGKTPLAEGLKLALDILRIEQIKMKHIAPVVVVLSDGRATWARNNAEPLGAAQEQAACFAKKDLSVVVIDTEERHVRLGLAKELAHAMQADLMRIEDLKAETLSLLAQNR